MLNQREEDNTQQATLVLAELDDVTSEGERKLYRALNHYQNAFTQTSYLPPLVTPIIGSWRGVLSRAFSIREDLFRLLAVRELFENQHSTLVYNPALSLGYLSDGNDLDAAPLAHITSVQVGRDRPDAENWSYFPEKGLYLVAELK